MAAIPTLPVLSSNATLEQVRDQLAILQKTISFALSSNLGSQNAYEFGNWLVTDDSLISENGTVGFSTAVTGADDIRIWAGNETTAIAPFRVYESGHVFVSNLTMQGGSIAWDLVNAPSPAEVGALPVDSPKLDKLSSIGDYLGALAEGQVLGLTGKMTYIGPFGIYSGVIGTHQLVADYALIKSAMIGDLSADKITAGTLRAVEIFGTRIYGSSTIEGGVISGSTINTDKDLNIGKNLNFGNGGTNYPFINLIPGNVYISADSGTQNMVFTAAGGVWAGANRLDGDMIGVFG